MPKDRCEGTQSIAVRGHFSLAVHWAHYCWATGQPLILAPRIPCVAGFRQLNSVSGVHLTGPVGQTPVAMPWLGLDSSGHGRGGSCAWTRPA